MQREVRRPASPLAATGSSHAAGRGPGQRLDLDVVRRSRCWPCADRLQVHADVTEARRPGGQRGRQQRGVVASPPERAEAAGDVGVGRSEDPRRVEQPEPPAAPAPREASNTSIRSVSGALTRRRLSSKRSLSAS